MDETMLICDLKNIRRDGAVVQEGNGIMVERVGSMHAWWVGGRAN